jgi:hypothetical protein
MSLNDQRPSIILGSAITRSALPRNYMKVTTAGYVSMCCSYTAVPQALHINLCTECTVDQCETRVAYSWRNERRLWLHAVVVACRRTHMLLTTGPWQRCRLRGIHSEHAKRTKRIIDFCGAVAVPKPELCQEKTACTRTARRPKPTQPPQYSPPSSP